MSGIINKFFRRKEEKKAKIEAQVDKTAATDFASSKTPAPKTDTISPKTEDDEDDNIGKDKPTGSTQATGAEKKVTKKIDPDIYKVLAYPVVTEKASDGAMDNKYTFAVPLTANKSEVAKKMINLYGVKPLKVNIVKVHGKKTRYGHILGQRKSWKKAIVSLAPGDKIEIYEGV